MKDATDGAVHGGRDPSPRVSVVIPVYNAEKTVRESVDSVLAQTYRNVEVVAVDDGSTDGSLDVLRGYGASIKVVEKKHGGVSPALNAGIDAMSGEWYTPLAADDIIYPGAIEGLAGVAARLEPSSKVIPASAMRVVYPDGASRVRFYDCNHMSTFEQGLRHLDHFVGGLSFLLHRSTFDCAGKYNELLRHEDYEFILRLLIVHKYRLLHIPLVTYEYRASEGSLSGQDPGQKKSERDSIVRSILGQVGGAERSRYVDALKKFRAKRRFVEAVYDFANSRDSHAGPGGPPANRSRLGAFARSHQAMYGAYIGAKKSSMCYALGWIWAARNPGDELVQRCRGQAPDKINELVEIRPVRLFGARFFT